MDAGAEDGPVGELVDEVRVVEGVVGPEGYAGRGAQLVVLPQVVAQGIVGAQAEEVVEVAPAGVVEDRFGAEGEGDVVEAEVVGGQGDAAAADGETAAATDAAAAQVVAGLAEKAELALGGDGLVVEVGVVADQELGFQAGPVLVAQTGAGLNPEQVTTPVDPVLTFILPVLGVGAGAEEEG